MMVTKQWIAALALASVSGVSMSATSPDFAIIKVTNKGQLILISAAKLDPRHVVQLQFPDPKHGTQCCQQLKASQFKLSEEDIVASNELTDSEAFTYESRAPSNWPKGPFIGMAAVGDFKHVRSQDYLIEGRAPDGSPMKATVCTSSEGVHLHATQGDRLQTHLYLWLGYDIADPTCKLPVTE
ncbi:hypothetical protein [Roseateles sp. YR242]|uniref:hypothetical protein n=1 Tax=Roseateles sp. YR242 TaxID=1855305 RepID=UPI000B8506FC|nr:hypothetical protein [Roseateles sp. YR242]